ncbi:hypothetical protein GUITHDRAFT_84943 [Guillardia theta CCMP2712]|uniref:ABC transporter domain-containing protein n=1 Tax=Guillardia theta (strain CCMP2712) TaxID=905079 RepID=L1JUR7_GUITC|nr:hypothetical protein GUITHDRAFT_84943 [Guillardia theta CCMP2712]EKX51950.1 hypothetical protein GUITHDRAFT_84943 [Guillardia theta CCMP2712]|eukprot:XP_005838930.1 hypothetical protein GUITHDRAFT_84943 [Guillardia theta CCMP2712]
MVHLSAFDKLEQGIDRDFLRRLAKLLPILIPSPFCKESFYLFLVAVLMVVRTLCDVWQIRNGTSIETAIISRDKKAFRKYMLRFVGAMLPIAFVNNLLKYGLNEIALSFRTRLTQHLYKEYLSGFTYYKLSNLDNRIGNPDQLLTQDVDKFATSLADLYSNVSKPILDIAIYAKKLAENVGIAHARVGAMLAYLAASGVVLTHMRRPLGQYTVKEQRYEGQFRHVTTRIISNSEEIAFYRGNTRESHWVAKSFGKLEHHIRKVMQFRFGVGMIDTIIAKYMATVVGYHIVSRPLLNMSNPKHVNSTQNELQEEYYRSGRMMLQMAQAVGRLVLAGRELTRLAGFTARIDELENVLKELQEDKYQRTLVRSSSRRNLDPPRLRDGELDQQDLQPGRGIKIEQDGIIRFENVPIVTPNSEVLVDSLSFEVKQGMNTLICGPNGCGKSSLFRILGDLWPVFGGKVMKPKPERIFYIPQKPYLCLGTLRDQVIYPHSRELMWSSGKKDDDLLDLLDRVSLGYLVHSRESGWESVEDWADVLSGGEKQRLAMARLFYHKPQFAILDECTSAVSVDVEGMMYSECQRQGITLLTVSHRKSLWKYHEWLLRFDGEGGAEFMSIQGCEQFGS